MEGTGEEAPTDIDMDIPIAEAYNRMKKLKPKRKAKVNKEAAVDGEDEGFSVRKENTGGDKSEFPHGITVSLFDDSVENHFKAVDNISKLCGETDMDDFDPAEIQRLSSSITFLREWREFNYPSRNLRFSCQNQSKEGRDFMGEIRLPQFSSATVPKKDIQNGDATSSELSKDFVMYVGGSVWALDWCPRVHSYSDSSIKSEFIAVAAHPPESSYHKIGAPLRGRGFVQIWCVLGTNMKKDMQSQDKKKRKRTSRNSETVITESSERRRPRGRPRKQTVNGSSNNTNSHSETVTTESCKQQRRRGKPRNQPTNGSSNNTNPHSEKVQTSAVQYLQDSSAVVSRDVALVDTSDHENVKTKLPKQMKPRGRRPKKAVNNSEVVQTPATKCSSTLLTGDLVSGNTCNHVLEENSQLVLEVSTMKSKSVIVPSKRIRLKDKGSTRVQVSKDAQEAELSLANPPTEENLALNMITCDFGSANCSIPNDVALPRMVFCLAHNGEVAWDAKWRPCDVSDKQRMGYLAVLLGDGALEVWEVPFPRTMKVIYSASQKEGTDPRFIRLRPVFRCPTIKRGGRQSIPLTLEWSASSPHDMILAGCHDGVVALWKFCATGSLQETRPLLCFSADTVTIRALTWVPVSRLVDQSTPLASKTRFHRKIKVMQPVYFVFADFGNLNSKSKIIQHSLAEVISYRIGLETTDMEIHSDDIQTLVETQHRLLKNMPHLRRLHTFPNANNLDAIINPLKSLHVKMVHNFDFTIYSESANIIVTAGHRGLKFWDLRDPFRPLWDFYPFQRVIYSLDWLPDPRCIIVSFDDGALRILSLLKAANDAPVTGKPFEGAQQKGFHSYLCSPFQIWSVHTSRLTGMVAYCGADGTALRFQLTTRAVEKDPLRNRAPHFLCGALTEENSTLTMFTSLPNTPFPMRKSLREWGEAPRTVRGYISVSNQEKRAKQKVVKVRSEEKHKALCKRGDLDSEFGPDCMAVTETREAGKVKTSSNSEADQRPIMVGEDNPDIMRGEVEEVEVFPSKTVAMHRVRWNTNKGSENWLCYGGAAGVVRFQEIDMCGE